MATIKEVARIAGVSAKTVSRVMHGYEHISPKTRQKVEVALEQLRYAASPVINHLRYKSSLSIGVLYGDPSSGYQSKLNHALLKACAESGRYLALELFDEKSIDWRGQLEAFLDRTGIGHLVLLPPMCDAVDLHDLLRERGVNHVLISPSSPMQGASSIAIDDRLAARTMTDHLLSLGHTKIGHISGRPGHVATLLRQQGYEESLQRAAIAINPDYIATGLFEFRTALDCADQMLSLDERPTAIFAANDEMAAAVIMTANRLGLRVPEDISVAGFDNTQIAETIWPELTTVAQPFYGFAKAALESIYSHSTTDETLSKTRILDFELILRGSTAAYLSPAKNTAADSVS